MVASCLSGGAGVGVLVSSAFCLSLSSLPTAHAMQTHKTRVDFSSNPVLFCPVPSYALLQHDTLRHALPFPFTSVPSQLFLLSRSKLSKWASTHASEPISQKEKGTRARQSGLESEKWLTSRLHSVDAVLFGSRTQPVSSFFCRFTVAWRLKRQTLECPFLE